MTDRRPRPYQVLYQHRNQVYLAKKHCSSAVRRSYYLALIKRLPRQLVYFALREHSIRLSYIYLRSLWDGFTNKMGKTKYVQ
jgi:hypothetical protein